jgi:hypothetical protein
VGRSFAWFSFVLTAALLTLSCAQPPGETDIVTEQQESFCREVIEARGSLSVIRNAVPPLNAASFRHLTELARVDVDELTALAPATSDEFNLVEGMKAVLLDFANLTSGTDPVLLLPQLKHQARLLSADVEALGAQAGCVAPASASGQ